MNETERALKAAAFDAAAAALEILDAGGGSVCANPAAEGGLDLPPAPQARREQRLVRGRAMRIEERDFAFEGRAYRVRAALDVEAQRRLEEDLYTRAFFDAATGLPNRELNDRAIADTIAARTPDAPFAIAVVEIDRYHELSALHGATATEALVARIGERITREAGQNLVARTGPDEFTVTFADPGPTDTLMPACRRLATRVCEPYLVDGVEIFVAASVGACGWPAGDTTPEGLRSKAKAAAREARRTAPGGALLFEAAMERRERERAREDNALRLALRDRRIGCAFQPKIDFRSGEVDSLEALMRWRDLDGAWSAPGNFLHLAQESGLTNAITELVFEETVASIDAVNAAFGRDVRIGFNVAARQACDTRFMRGFLRRLGESGHAPRFVLEITEEAFLPSGPFQTRVLPMIREIGARISIDDFGSGYSSLATIADITADEVKVDRSIIVDIDQRPRNQSLLRAIESLGDALSTEVIVEGVETEEEYVYLRDHTRIRVAQGYYFSKPLMLSGVETGVEWRESARGSGFSMRFGRERERRGG